MEISAIEVEGTAVLPVNGLVFSGNRKRHRTEEVWTNIMDIQYIEIPSITLEWSKWFPWSRFKLDARSNPNAIKVPNLPGVYEVRLIDSNERLTIGKATNLRRRVKQALVKGKVPHSSGKRIREGEDTSFIVVRWAMTERPAAVEEALHKRYREVFGKLPKYTKRT